MAQWHSTQCLLFDPWVILLPLSVWLSSGFSHFLLLPCCSDYSKLPLGMERVNVHIVSCDGLASIRGDLQPHSLGSRDRLGFTAVSLLGYDTYWRISAWRMNEGYLPSSVPHSIQFIIFLCIRDGRGRDYEMIVETLDHVSDVVDGGLLLPCNAKQTAHTYM